MNALNAIRNHPLHMALALAMAFGVWVAYDASSPRSTPPHDNPIIAEVSMAAPPVVEPAKHPGIVTADLIPKLQPGMARVAVEELIGQPPAGLVHPVAMVDGKFIYRASYLANLDSGPPMSAPAPRSIIALEYDAGRPGHPLLKVHIPDPMS
jgi:hypothetical protein